MSARSVEPFGYVYRVVGAPEQRDRPWTDPRHGVVFALGAAPADERPRTIIQYLNLYTAPLAPAQADAWEPSEEQVARVTAKAMAKMPGACHWTQQEDGYDCWTTGCGHEFMVNEGPPEWPFCNFCARPLVVGDEQAEAYGPCECNVSSDQNCESCDQQRRDATAKAQQP